MPINSFEHIKEVASGVSVDACLDSGWRSIVDLVCDDDVVFKAKAFLALHQEELMTRECKEGTI